MAYASEAELAAWLAPEPAPANAVRLLELASTAVDVALYGVAYDRDDPEVLAVLAKATVRQAHWVIERDDETGAQDDVQAMSTGKRSFSRFARGGGSAGSAGTARLAPGAVDVLRTSGLLFFDPLVVG
ncbi:hypothetical protein OG384_04265 [Streptomyces sp. NBC_01324]|uniref:hypothetical protein n=1 Tax=Streptomyces sp. NBC_01324 TaxID=2903826 RepID=UPI002E0F8CDE|nr:hypothetical protein OG384_04265 [Streptomyces sp. NBC_01324]